MSSSRTVWGIGTERTIRPLWALAELGLDYEHQKVLPRGGGIENSGLLERSPRHKVPFFEDDRVSIGESAAIVCYLADRYSDRGLPMPALATAERAVLFDHIFYIMTEMDARLYTVRMHCDPPQGLSQTYGSAPVAVDAAKKYVGRGLNEAARWFEDGRAFVMGEDFGVADLLLTTCLDWALGYEMDIPDALTTFRDKIAKRQGYIQATNCNDASKL
ncbi:glutathione S-transferase family protein [Microbulbifer agarilyticus]|uniref:glutathione S-transferase family protein n=1 Tax=Microbulbifer agarilyticus TaxID=260552 RepID=UPI001C94D072|nr:glutathione S-transferase family protein [Microbulbifer agarilyticus]MBY6190348.1 glutathione S-transferase family protein [Microbulbifer agarilyticus]